MRRQQQARRKPQATTADIVGDGNNGVSIPHKWRRHYNHLIRLRDTVVRRQSGLARDALEEQPAFSTHMADAGTDNFDRDLALSMLSGEHDALYEIEQALDRIRNRTYGICELTGKPIEQARLEAIPWTRFSKEASQRIEQEGGTKRVRLGERDSVARVEAAAQEPGAED